MSVILATTPQGHQAVFVVAEAPTPEDFRRWAAVAALPGLRDATWTGAAGTCSR